MHQPHGLTVSNDQSPAKILKKNLPRKSPAPLTGACPGKLKLAHRTGRGEGQEYTE